MDPGDLYDALQARIDETYVFNAYTQAQVSARDRLRRLETLDAFIDGRWPYKKPDGKTITDTPRIEDLVTSGIEDTMRAASGFAPTLRVEAPTEAGEARAEHREQIIANYWQTSNLLTKLPGLYRDLAASGLAAIKVMPDFNKPKDHRFPVYSRLDPRGVLPPPGWEIGTEPEDVIAVRKVKLRALKKRYPNAALSLLQKVSPNKLADTTEVEVIEYFDDEMILCIAVMGSGNGKPYVKLYEAENRPGCIPVILIGRNSADGQIRGQFDTMQAPLVNQNRITTYALDYVDQAVYAPVVKDWPGDIPFGPGAFIEKPSSENEIGRLAPAQMDTSVFRLIADMERYARRAGQVPESRSGEISQSIGSAAFVNSLQGGFNAVVADLQSAMADGLVRANEVAQKQDVSWCDQRKSIIGLARGGQFRLTYTPSEAIKEGDYGNIVTYGTGAGLNPFDREIRVLQRTGNGIVSQRWARENLEGVDNPLLEERRILDEQALASLAAAVFAQAQAGNPEPLARFQEALDKNENPLVVMRQILEAFQPVNPQGQQRGPMGVIQGGGLDAAMQRKALEVGAIPGGENSLPAESLPPLSALGIA